MEGERKLDKGGTPEADVVKLRARLDLRNKVIDRLLIFLGGVLLALLVTSRVEQHRLDVENQRVDRQLYFSRLSQAIEKIESDWWQLDWDRMDLFDARRAADTTVTRLTKTFDSTFFTISRTVRQFDAYFDDGLRAELNNQLIIYDASALAPTVMKEQYDSLFNHLRTRRLREYQQQIAPDEVRKRLLYPAAHPEWRANHADSAFLRESAALIYREAESLSATRW